MTEEKSLIEQSIQKTIDARIPWQIQKLNPRVTMVRAPGTKQMRQKTDDDGNVVKDKNGKIVWEPTGKIYNGKEPCIDNKHFKDSKGNWRKYNYTIRLKQFVRYLRKCHAWGLICGGDCNLIIVDIDTDDEKLVQIIVGYVNKNIPTFIVKTGSGKYHIYFVVKDMGQGNKKFRDEDDGMILEFRGEGSFCLGPNSIHPNGKYYYIPEEYKDIPIRELESLDELTEHFEPLIEHLLPVIKPEDISNPLVNAGTGYTNEQKVKIAQLYTKARMDIPNVADAFGKQLPKEGEQGDCPTGHSSKGGQCFSYKGRGFNCFHCDVKGNAFDLALAINNGDVDGTIEFLAQKWGIELEWDEPTLRKKIDDLPEVLDKLKSEYKRSEGEEQPEPEFIKNNKGKIRINYKAIAKNFWKLCPYNYTRGKLWYIWNGISWDDADETDIMYRVDQHYDENKLSTENATVKGSLLEAFRKHGRAYGPKEPHKTWIQFGDVIIDYRTKERFKPSPDWFMTNVIPHKLPKEDRANYDIPTIDKLLNDWVGSRSLAIKELMAHMLLNDVVIQQAVFFRGYGSNGKTTLIELMQRIVGRGNHSTTTISNLSKQFEAYYVLRNKLICFINEIDITKFLKTAALKEITGGGNIRCEKKGGGIDEVPCITLIVISVNKMPQTKDTTDGFYRRCCIVDFPNKFNEKIKNIIEDIPEAEIENFCYKAIYEYLPELFKRGYYDKDKPEQRKERYEQAANDLKFFLEETYEITSDSNDYIFPDIAYNNYCEYCFDKKITKLTQKQFGGLMALTPHKKIRKTIGGIQKNIYPGLKSITKKDTDVEDNIEKDIRVWQNAKI